MLLFACVTGRSELNKFFGGAQIRCSQARGDIWARGTVKIDTKKRSRQTRDIWARGTVKIGTQKGGAGKLERARTRKQNGPTCSHKRAFRRPIASSQWGLFSVEFLKIPKPTLKHLRLPIGDRERG